MISAERRLRETAAAIHRKRNIVHLNRCEEGKNPGYDAPEKPAPSDRWDLRDWLMIGADMPRVQITLFIGQRLEASTIIMQYGCKVWSRRRRIRVDVEAHVRLWVEGIATMATAHRPEDFDGAEMRTDDMLGPLLSAPVAQIKEFALKLADALEADVRIPYLVWRPYCELVRDAMKRMTPERNVELKECLAREVAEAVERDVQPQLLDALIGALKWRDEKTLREVKRAVTGGEKAKLVGRQSCLFLTAGDARVML